MAGRPNPYRDRGAGGKVYRRKAATLIASEAGRTCCICGGEIDRTLTRAQCNDPGYPTIQHDPPLSQGGRLLEDIAGVAHKGCNSAEGRQLQLAAAQYDPEQVEHSREW